MSMTTMEPERMAPTVLTAESRCALFLLFGRHPLLAAPWPLLGATIDNWMRSVQKRRAGVRAPAHWQGRCDDRDLMTKTPA